MIAIFKLEKLHRAHRLRKIASVFAAAERALVSGRPLGSGELNYFSDLARLLSRDAAFAPEALEIFDEAAIAFARVAPAETQRRALNRARHLLLAETGIAQADWDFIDGEGRLDSARRRIFPGMLVYLDDVRSPFNVGSMFRSAESFGAEKIFLSPFCADPNHARARRSAMGCAEILPWERAAPFGDAGDLEPWAQGPVFALETGGAPLSEFPFPRAGLLIAGSEELGVSPEALAASDASLGRVSIPCHGAKGSLNVSVAFGIVMQAWAAALAGPRPKTKTTGDAP